MEGLLARLGFAEFTPIQKRAIPAILEGRSVVLRSETGSGKTLAYVAPLLEMMGREGGDAKLLVLLPTRELAQQVGRVFDSLESGEDIAVIYGGVEYEPQREVLARDPRVIVATPGRLQDLIAQECVDLKCLKYFVLDEVDQMVDLGFREAITELAAYRAEGAQTICVTATLNDLIRDVVGDVELIEDGGAPLAAQRIVQSAYFVEQSMMEHLLLHLLRTKAPQKSILFCRSRKMADRLAERLREVEISAEAIHSERSQAAREHIMRRFVSGETQILVATDLIARGIDVDGVTHIFNFGLPQTPEQYIHRIGRTGRAGAEGEAVTLLCADENEALKRICATMRQSVTTHLNHPYMTPAVTASLSATPKVKSKRKGRR